MVKPLGKSNLSLNSFASRVVDYWNFSPSDIFNVNNCGEFQREAELYKFFEFIKGRALVRKILPAPPYLQL